MLLIFSRRQIYFGKYFQRSQWFYKTQCNLIGEFVLVWPCRYLFQPGQYFRWGGVELTLLLGDLGQHVGVVGGGDVDSPSTTTTQQHNNYKTTTITLITTIKQQQQQVTSCVRSFSCTTRMLSSYWRSSPIHFHHLCLNKKVLTPVDLSLFLVLFGWIYFPEISNLTHHLIVHVFCLSLRQAYWLFFSFNRFI